MRFYSKEKSYISLLPAASPESQHLLSYEITFLYSFTQQMANFFLNKLHRCRRSWFRSSSFFHLSHSPALPLFLPISPCLPLSLSLSLPTSSMSFSSPQSLALWNESEQPPDKQPIKAWRAAMALCNCTAPLIDGHWAPWFRGIAGVGPNCHEAAQVIDGPPRGKLTQSFPSSTATMRPQGTCGFAWLTSGIFWERNQYSLDFDPFKCFLFICFKDYTK